MFHRNVLNRRAKIDLLTLSKRPKRFKTGRFALQTFARIFKLYCNSKKRYILYNCYFCIIETQMTTLNLYCLDKSYTFD